MRIGKEIALTLANDNNNIVIHFHKSSNEALKLKKRIEKLGSECAVIKRDLSKKCQFGVFFTY